MTPNDKIKRDKDEERPATLTELTDLMRRVERLEGKAEERYCSTCRNLKVDVSACANCINTAGRPNWQPRPSVCGRMVELLRKMRQNDIDHPDTCFDYQDDVDAILADIDGKDEKKINFPPYEGRDYVSGKDGAK